MKKCPRCNGPVFDSTAEGKPEEQRARSESCLHCGEIWYYGLPYDQTPIEPLPRIVGGHFRRLTA